MALHAELRFGVRLFREPDAGNPPVRFDEREEETELSQTGLRRRGESPANRHREVNVTAPLLDSTLFSIEALKFPQKGETKAQACANNACLHQLRLHQLREFLSCCCLGAPLSAIMTT